MLSMGIWYQPYTVIYTHLAQIWGLWVTCWVEMLSVRPDWEWQPPQTASLIHIRCIHSVWAHWYAVHGPTVAALHSHTHTSWFFGGFWVTCGVKMISLHHGWGWPPPQTASLIHIRHIQSVWAHWYAVHGHTVAALHSHTHTTWLRFWGSGSLMWIKNDVITSCLRLLSYSNWLTHPY